MSIAFLYAASASSNLSRSVRLSAILLYNPPIFGAVSARFPDKICAAFSNRDDAFLFSPNALYTVAAFKSAVPKASPHSIPISRPMARVLSAAVIASSRLPILRYKPISSFLTANSPRLSPAFSASSIQYSRCFSAPAGSPLLSNSSRRAIILITGILLSLHIFCVSKYSSLNIFSPY